MAVLQSTQHQPPTMSTSTPTRAQAQNLIAALNPARSNVSFLTVFIFHQLTLTTKYLTLNTLFIITAMFTSCRYIIAALWKSIEPFRRRVFFEFMTSILNPYAVALFVFWPGWAVLGLGYLAWKHIG